MFETFEKIKLLAKKQGISLNTLEERVGLGKNYIYSLKNKKTPSVEHIAKSLTTSMCPPTTCLVVQITLQ